MLMKKCDKCNRIYSLKEPSIGTIEFQLYNYGDSLFDEVDEYDLCCNCARSIRQIIQKAVKQ